MLKPVVKIFPFPNLPKIPYVFRIQIAICHLHTDAIQMILQSIYVRVTHRLRLVYIYRLFHGCQIPVHAFDFVDIPKLLPNLHFILLFLKQSLFFYLFCRFVCNKFSKSDSVGPALYHKNVRFFDSFYLQWNFRCVGTSHAILNFPMNFTAL